MATAMQKAARQAAAMVRVGVAVPLSTSAGSATADFTFELPAGARDVTFRTKTGTAFGAVTDCQLSIGSAAGGAQYVAAVSVKALGQVSHTLVGAGVADLDTVPGNPGQSRTFYARLTQSGGNSATGAATLFVDYGIPN